MKEWVKTKKTEQKFTEQRRSAEPGRGAAEDSDRNPALPSLRDLPPGSWGDMGHGLRICFYVASNRTNRYHMLLAVMLREGHIITSVVCWPEMHNLHLIRENVRAAQTQLSSKTGRSRNM